MMRKNDVAGLFAEGVSSAAFPGENPVIASFVPFKAFALGDCDWCNVILSGDCLKGKKRLWQSFPFNN